MSCSERHLVGGAPKWFPAKLRFWFVRTTSGGCCLFCCCCCCCCCCGLSGGRPLIWSGMLDGELGRLCLEEVLLGESKERDGEMALRGTGRIIRCCLYWKNQGENRGENQGTWVRLTMPTITGQEINLLKVWVLFVWHKTQSQQIFIKLTPVEDNGDKNASPKI